MIGLAILIKRAISGRSILSSIPKGYLPIGKSDVPKVSELRPAEPFVELTSRLLLLQKAYQLISNEYDRASVIAHVSQPKGRRQEGWGRPGSSRLLSMRSTTLADQHRDPIHRNRLRECALSHVDPLDHFHASWVRPGFFAETSPDLG